MNLDHLLLPLPGADSIGPDMSFSVEFDRLQELRREDDATIPRGELDAEHKRADWPAVMKAAESLLAERTKDLRLAAWWAEAAAKTTGYAGLADGVALYAGLCESFWDQVHPQPEGGDAELRIGSLTWLLAEVADCARRLPVLGHGDTRCSLAEAGHLRLRARSEDAEAARRAREVLERVQRGTPATELLQVLDAARRISSSLDRLQVIVDARLGADGPAFVGAREAMQEAVSGIERLAQDLGAHAPVAAAVGAPVAPGAGVRDSVAITIDNQISTVPRSREQALVQLRMVADYFRRHEPHSPVAYLADRAARWGDMPLHVWLRAVLKDQPSMDALDELLGVNPPGSPSEG